MPFKMTDMINHCYYHDEFQLFVVYAPLGYGKSTYAVKVLSELYDKDWEKVKDYVVFPPKDFVRKCVEMNQKGQREKAIVWDDAGLWLFALQKNDVFVQAVIKYMNVARTNWGAMILTTPTPSWITYKMRNFPQHINVKVIKASTDTNRGQRLRYAKGYRAWTAPDFKHSGVRKIFEDYYDATMPDEFYKWYKPIRDDYAKQASALMNNSLSKLLAKDEAPEKTEAIQNAYTV